MQHEITEIRDDSRDFLSPLTTVIKKTNHASGGGGGGDVPRLSAVEFPAT